MEQSDMAHIDQTLFAKLPFGLLTFDPDGRVSSLNETMQALLGMRADDLLGRQLAQLPESAQRLLGSEPHVYHDLANHRWLSRETHHGSDGERLLLLVDVTEQERMAEDNARLRQQVEDLKLTDELTGMPNQRAIAQALDLHVSRSRRYQNPLSIVLVSVDLRQLASVRPLSTDPTMLAVSRFLRDRLRWVDQIGRWDDDLFLLVLPETTEEHARGLLDKISTEQDSMQLPEPHDELRPQLNFGLACWGKGDDMRTLLRAATNNLRGDGGA